MMSERLKHPKLWLATLALWLLSTRIGTVILCGKASLSRNFPYLHKFSEISQGKREEIIMSWAKSWFFLFRLLFKAAKVLVPLAFFTQVRTVPPLLYIYQILFKHVFF